jgi:hypothetical protein
MDDPYREFHIAHPLYLKGVQEERQRIIALIEQKLTEDVTIHRSTLTWLIQGVEL